LRHLHGIHFSISGVPFGGLILTAWVFFALASLFEEFPRIKLGQVLGLVVAVAWGLGYVLNSEDDREAFLATSQILVILLFAGMWAREFRLLMARRDDEFPGRFDKPAWVFALTALAPAGVWLHRSYRRAESARNRIGA